MAKQVNMFEASKALSERVAFFMKARVNGAILKARYDDARKKYQSAVEALENVKGTMIEEHYLESLKALEDDIAAKKAEYEKNIEETATFEYSEADKALYKSYKDGESVSDALCKWARAYDLEIAGTDFLKQLLTGIAGLKPENGRGIIKSKGTSFVKLRSKDDILKTMYGMYTEKMLDVGTLKVKQIPADVYAMYAPKAKKAK